MYFIFELLQFCFRSDLKQRGLYRESRLVFNPRRSISLNKSPIRLMGFYEKSKRENMSQYPRINKWV